MKLSSITLLAAGASAAAVQTQATLGTWYLASMNPGSSQYGQTNTWYAFGYPNAVPGFPAFAANGGTFAFDEERMGLSSISSNSFAARASGTFVLNQTATVNGKTKVAMGSISWNGVSRVFLEIPVVAVYDV